MFHVLWIKPLSYAKTIRLHTQLVRSVSVDRNSNFKIMAIRLTTRNRPEGKNIYSISTIS